MTIIDKYIEIHINQPTNKLAMEIGVSESFVKSRLEILKAPNDPHIMRVSDKEEIAALLNLIAIRQTGWAAEAAMIRIRKLESQ